MSEQSSSDKPGSSTPRTDRAAKYPVQFGRTVKVVRADFARTLERESASRLARIGELERELAWATGEKEKLTAIVASRPSLGATEPIGKISGASGDGFPSVAWYGTYPAKGTLLYSAPPSPQVPQLREAVDLALAVIGHLAPDTPVDEYVANAEKRLKALRDGAAPSHTAPQENKASTPSGVASEPSGLRAGVSPNEPAVLSSTRHTDMEAARASWCRDRGLANMTYPGQVGLEGFAAGWQDGFAAGAAPSAVSATLTPELKELLRKLRHIGDLGYTEATRLIQSVRIAR